MDIMDQTRGEGGRWGQGRGGRAGLVNAHTYTARIFPQNKALYPPDEIPSISSSGLV